MALLSIAPLGIAAARGAFGSDDSFVAKHLTEPRGTTIRFRWAGHDPHNVTPTHAPRRAVRFVRGPRHPPPSLDTFALCLFFWRSAQDFDRATSGATTPRGQLVITAAAIVPPTSTTETTSTSRPVREDPGKPGRESPSTESRTAHAASARPAA